jgi:sugar lactone lactonase YvrE
VFIDDDQTIYVADHLNHRIVEWKSDANNGQIVAGGNDQGNRNDQLNYPTKVIVDKENDSLIICDRLNRRVVRWPRRNGQSGEILISNIDCYDLIMDNDGYLYVSDDKKHEVRRWKMGETNGTIVAGGNGQGNRLDQLNDPYYIFIDEDHSVYVSDENNHRVMKWLKDAKEGIVVAGGQGQGNGLRQFSDPDGIIVDQLGSVYVADWNNHRVMRWLKGAEEGTIVVGGNGLGNKPNQLRNPVDLSFDRQNNLYVVDHLNHRVQRFDVNSNGNG